MHVNPGNRRHARLNSLVAHRVGSEAWANTLDQKTAANRQAEGYEILAREVQRAIAVLAYGEDLGLIILWL
jgi:hypothetical protein